MNLFLLFALAIQPGDVQVKMEVSESDELDPLWQDLDWYASYQIS